MPERERNKKKKIGFLKAVPERYREREREKNLVFERLCLRERERETRENGQGKREGKGGKGEGKREGKRGGEEREMGEGGGKGEKNHYNSPVLHTFSKRGRQNRIVMVFLQFRRLFPRTRKTGEL